MNQARKPTCPACGGIDIRHSLPGGVLDSLMQVFRRAPHRCRCCEHRFYLATPPEIPEPRNVPNQASPDAKR
ncbi:MAG: hypothetical protein ABI759_04565 [Candidatus Solibacter sp.]